MSSTKCGRSLFCFLMMLTLRPYDARAQVVADSVEVHIGGFVKLDAIHDFDPLATPDGFNTQAIPTGQRPADIPSERTTFNSNASRFSLELVAMFPLGRFRTFVEGDFAGGNNHFRLRHAYGEFRGLLAGQTWSNFVDVESSPFTLDFDGSGALVLFRQAQVRYSRDWQTRWSFAAALEDTKSDITAPPEEGVPLSRFPDATAHVRYTLRRGHLQLGGLLREIGFETASDAQTRVAGWGGNFSGSYKTWGEDHFRFTLAYGHGLGRYVSDLSGTGSDAAPSSDGGLTALPAFGGTLSYEHWWAARFVSSVVLARTWVDNAATQPTNAYHATYYTSANLVWFPISQGYFGMEAIWGQRTDKDGQNGDALRLLFSFKYTFSYDIMAR